MELPFVYTVDKRNQVWTIAKYSYSLGYGMLPSAKYIGKEFQ